MKTLSPAKRLFRLLSVDRADIINIYICAGLNGLISLTIPLGVQAVIGLIMAGSVSASWLLLVGLVVIGVVASGALLVMQVTLTEILQQRLFVRSAIEFTYRIPRVRPEALGGSYAPELVNRFFDTTMVQKGLPKVLIDLPSALLQIVFGLLLLSFYHPYFIIFGLMLMLLLVAIFRFTWYSGLSSSLNESKYKHKVAHWLEELARSLYTFKQAGDSPLPMQRADALLKGYLGARRSHFRVLMLQLVSTVAFKTLITAAFLDTGFAYLGPNGMVEGACLVEARTKAMLFNRIKETLLADGMPLPLMLHSLPIAQIEERQGEQLISHTVS